MSTLEVNTIAPITGSSDVTLGGSSKNIKFASGTTVDFSTNTPTLTLGSDMKMTPAFRAQLSSGQSISDATYTKIEFDSENFDTDNCYDNSTNYRFTPTVAGKYYVYASVECYGGATNSVEEVNPAIRKNGSNVTRSSFSEIGGGFHVVASYLSATLDMNGSTDYVEVFAYCDSSSTPSVQHDGRTYFGAFRIVGA